MLDARGDAARADVREELRTRARDIERARGAVSHEDNLEALELWQGLVSGRWSICDHFDTDGRRFLMVRENNPRFPSQPGLSQRETQLLELYGRGQSQKLIAYELGLSPPRCLSGCARWRESWARRPWRSWSRSRTRWAS